MSIVNKRLDEAAGLVSIDGRTLKEAIDYFFEKLGLAEVEISTRTPIGSMAKVAIGRLANNSNVTPTCASNIAAVGTNGEV